MGKQRIVAETGAGQHGVATATACALLGLECHVYMGSEDMDRQALNVFRMRLLGAEVCRVDAGSRTLKDAINEAMRDWVTNVADTYYLLGSVLGPHPYPLMVREFQSVIGREARGQIASQTGRLPDAIVACVGGGSNAIGIFDGFIGDREVRLIGVEAGGEQIARGRHAARFAGGSPGVLQGTRTFVLQDEDGNIELTHSISAGLDYAVVGRLGDTCSAALQGCHRKNRVSRIAATFDRLRRERRPGLVTYTTAGDPDLPRSGAILEALDRAGADVLEVGVPFSDPLADGPVIQRASERALAAGGSLRSALSMIEKLRPRILAPIVVFSYANPLLRLGLDAFARQAAGAGVDGVLALDLPIEEAGGFRETLASAGIDTIFLLSPTTTDTRLRRAAELGSGFLYGISRLGVTGARARVASGAEALGGRSRAHSAMRSA